MTTKEKPIIVKRDKSYRCVTEYIHDLFIAYCHIKKLNTGDTLSKALAEYMKNHK